ncbi:Gamma-glutamyltransferase [Methylobacterium sp. 4-46]|uniref:gamma-glutamyltransferase family protein n=1 Tax=unclassified Methylobacterium TaxID=2615210 RepID=UPI000152E6C4|nr:MULTISPECIES: gamma-glutamyltransferase family protein [Methylobacterium]ACA16996.1 Gamma-glutamyltransferase [Methylobacterium sp. 4-46]WFT82685.1 gamma-glutamyltransferase family protein [Methylobacterium nodulans]
MRDFSQPGRSPVYAANAAVATSHPLSTLAAIEVLREGGNAVDAAIAAVAVQGVVDPLMTGIGGDCFALYLPKGAERPIALNGSGRSPAAAEDSWYLERGLTIEPTSPHAVTIPGAVAAWDWLVQRHGTRSLGDLLRPAITCAEEGYPVQSRVAWDWARNRERVAADPASAAAYLIDGAAPAAGAIMRHPALARTLRRIAAEGPRGFYEGPVADDMVATLRARGGLHSLDDFAGTAPEEVVPVTTRYRGYDVYECPPSGQGLAVLMMLNVLSGFEVGALPDVDRVHLFAEACKQAYHHRDALFADPVAARVPVSHLLSEAWRASARGAIDMARAQAPILWPEVAHADTVYLCVVDRDGNAISLINSIFQGFGSGILAPESGVLLHNRGFSFRVEPGHPNTIAPRKRPLHTIIPGMLMREGRAVAPFGVMGGHYQAMGHVELLTGLIDRGLDVQEALDVPRSFAYGGGLELEAGFSEASAAALAARGHAITRVAVPLGGGQAIWIDHARGVLCAGSDPRKDGSALGY